MAESTPIRRRDLFFPVRGFNSVANWVNKGRFIPARLAATKAVPLLLAIVGLMALAKLR